MEQEVREGVLICAFGGARDEEGVEGFLEDLLGKRPSRELVERVRQKYRRIGSSPLYSTLSEIARRLEGILKGKKVFWGVAFGRPSLEEVIEEVKEEGIEEIWVIDLSPYRSPYTYFSTRAEEALMRKGIEPVRLPPWHDHPSYCSLWAKKLKEGWEKLGGRAPVLFIAHSLREDIAQGSPYLQDLQGTIRGIRRVLGDFPSRLAFVGAPPSADWVGPRAEDALLELKEEGYRRAIVLPIGFVCDHLETLYDLDVELMGWAKGERLELLRLPCLNASPDFLSFLKGLIEGGGS